MFNDNQDNQAQTNTDIDQVAQDISTHGPSIGLGMNPSTFSPVLPPQASQTPPPPANDSSADPSSLATPTTIVSPLSTSTDLDSIKNDALSQLSPLVGMLDQSPEEKYKTLMMLIQASDNHELIKEAYDAANAITDEKFKAEALLGIVNEINYFTQKTNA